ncbi:hypothetical protein KAFR_0A03030 [Kazachstania africana CBS 2517]|uniref:Transcription initiation factor TFIID subunit 13 n=1 Tax=Kazachstania africana (strain ATCC 22294 / BCRC 22015 / CBS 2517 / CECT 1963 / NBRC 1671 / NRRL Y-8276) TaxID=1071382 RepID=H2AMY8_KAZAF|nr:hypothetical protein KAFR_0A03030 [Kazachstania africana CBS 2517]CCF55738.1 hypothetical protein KAFR_0A03030 [Kazachstania africana CBS 2517]
MSRRLKRTNLFSKDISSLLYAYGDVPQPLTETVQCIDELVSQYLVDICATASQTSQNSSRNKIKLEDFRFAIRKDPIKLARAEELIATNKVIIEAKKQFNETDNQSLKRYRGQDNEFEDDDEDNDIEGAANEEENASVRPKRKDAAKTGGKVKATAAKTSKNNKDDAE